MCAAPKGNQYALGNNGGRKDTYDFELCKEVCEKVAEGKNIKKVLAEKEHYPAFVTWCKWKREHEELANLYTRSMQDKSESMDEAIDDVMLMVRSGQLESHAARVLIDTLKWKASKYYPKMFGDKLDMTSGGESLNSSVTEEKFNQLLQAAREGIKANKG